MTIPARLIVLSLAVFLAAPAAAADRMVLDDSNQPHDLILAIDVSLSMTQRFPSSIKPGKELPPSDPAGIRWDGVQFAIDSALRQDRIALVVFRGESLVLTRYLDPSGFVSLDGTRRYGGKTGREALRALIAEIKSGEVKVAAENRGKAANDPAIKDFDYNTLRSLPRPTEDKLVMWDGTSVVLALKKIEKDLLPRIGGRRGFVLLFTDGFDTSPFPRTPGEPREEGHEHGEADYAYVRKLLDHKNDRTWMARQVDDWVKPFRDKRVPVFTFGLGEDCHMAFLAMIAEKSTSTEATVPAESKHASTAVVLFDQIRRLAWELRHYWLGTPEVVQRGGDKIVRIPPLAGWHDMGILLFAKSAAAGDPATVAPKDVRVRAVEGPQQAAALEERTSQSHRYYYLAPDSPIKAALGPRTALELALSRSEREPRCYVALRTEHPLFEYRQPEQGPARYTPKDAIPFEVDFHPDSAGIFKPEHFQVQVLVLPARELGRGVRRVPAALRHPLVLTPTLHKTEGQPNRTVFRFEQDVGDPGLVLDPDPRSARDPDLIGPYTVDVTITGAKGGPFEGYERRLIRRTLHIKDYPDLKTSAESLTLTNTGDTPGLATLPVELDIVTARADHVATVKATVEQGPSLPGQKSLPASLFRWRQGADRAVGDELRLFGPKGQLYLELPGERWAELVPGEYEGGVALLQTTWEPKPVRVSFRVHKARYQLNVHAPPLFDLSQTGSDPVRQSITAVLKTPLATRESVSLQVEKDDKATSSSQEVAFSAVKGKAEVRLKVHGLGQPVTVAGGKFAAAGGPALALSAAAPLPPGRYRRTFWLTGPAVTAAPVVVEVVADRPAVVVEGSDRDWIKGTDKVPRPQRELFLLGLAGTHVQRTVAYYSVEGGKTLPALATLDALLPAAGKDRLSVSVPQKEVERLSLDFAVPLAVEEGTYTGRLRLTDSSHKPPREADLFVHLQVVHYGIATEERGPISLKFAETCTSTASAAITVVTPAEKVPVRWWVEQVAAAELEKEGRDGQALPQGLLDVKSSEGVSVLGQKPKDPLYREKPMRLTLEARRAQLAPGLYRARLRFHVREDDSRAEKEEGTPYDLEITMLVPGRRIELLAPPDPRCQVGKDTERHVRMSCYGCEPGQSVWQTLDDSGNPTGPENRIQRLIKSEQDARNAGLMHHTFAFTVRPERAGKNLFRVACPPCCRDNPSENQLTRTGQLNARGKIEVRPRFCYPGEQVTVEVRVDPSSVRGSGLELEVVNRQEIERNASPLTLTSAGGGRFSAKHTFEHVGEYEIRLAANAPAGLELEPVRVSVSFTLDASTELGTIEYGNGSLAALFGAQQEVSVPGAIRLTNKEGRKCRWKARLRYPVTTAVSRDIFTQDPEETTSPRFDESKHLLTHLLAEDASESAEENWAASGILNDDQTLALSIESKLAEPAQAEVWSGSRNHPTLSSHNGMVVEIFLEWLDDSGQPVEQRTVFVPFVVRTGRGWTMFLLLLLIPLAIFIGYLIWRKYRARQARKRATRSVVVAGDEHLGIAPRTETAQSHQEGPALSGPPEAQSPSSGDDLLPDYLRGD